MASPASDETRIDQSGIELILRAARLPGPWRVKEVQHGRNSRVFHALNADGKAYGVKFFQVDERHRASREFAILAALPKARALAPDPVYVAEPEAGLSVLVTTWLRGQVRSRVPEGQEWDKLMGHYASIHQLQPSELASPIPGVIFGPDELIRGRYSIVSYAQRLRSLGESPQLESAIEALADRGTYLTREVTPRTPCRVDGNLTNFVRRSPTWASVDWEGGGWGDPAFEMAELSAHPSVSPAVGDWPGKFQRYRGFGGVAESDRVEEWRPWLSLWWWLRKRFDAWMGFAAPPSRTFSPQETLAAAREGCRSIISLPE